MLYSVLYLIILMYTKNNPFKFISYNNNKKIINHVARKNYSYTAQLNFGEHRHSF